MRVTITTDEREEGAGRNLQRQIAAARGAGARWSRETDLN
jgi:hypothetical protein